MKASALPLPAQKRERRSRASKFWSRFPLHAIIIALVIIWSVPTVALLISSFRPAALINTSGWWTALLPPWNFSLDLYQQALSGRGMGQSFLNSLFITIPATVIPLMIAAFAAYAFAWMRFPGRDFLFVLVVGLLVVPLQTTLIPVLRLYNEIGATGTFIGIWLAHTGYGLPLAIYLLRNFFSTLPKDMFESAFLDGASSFTAFFRLALPLSVPAIASLAIFQFMWVWNDLLIALIYLGGADDVAPMTLRIANLTNSLGGGWQVLTAAAFISMMLPLLVFFTLQRYFVRGLLAGSVKG